MLKPRLSLFFLSLFSAAILLYPNPQTENIFSSQVSSYSLDNGLRVILLEDYTLPLVSVVVGYNVGTIHEKKGKTGLAYFLDKLMFEGSRNIGPKKHISFIQRLGGEFDAVTTEDKTIFFQTVPSNFLASVLWLESDRMNSLVITSDNVQHMKNEQIKEIRFRNNVDPFLESSLYFDKLLFPHFSYHHPIFGLETDLRNLSLEDVRKFYQTYYTPNNAILCIVGNIRKAATQSLIEKYFGSIPKGKTVPKIPNVEFPDSQEIKETIEGVLASTPGFFLGYRIAPPYSEDYFTLVLIEYILIHGNSSRLVKRLINKERIALRISGGIERKVNLAAFKIFVTCSNNITAEMSQKAIISELNKLKTSLISEEELNKAKNMLKMDYLSQFESTIDKSFFLVENFLSERSLDDAWKDLDRYLNIKPTDIISVINRYFAKEDVLLYVNIK